MVACQEPFLHTSSDLEKTSQMNSGDAEEHSPISTRLDYSSSWSQMRAIACMPPCLMML